MLNYSLLQMKLAFVDFASLAPIVQRLLLEPIAQGRTNNLSNAV